MKYFLHLFFLSLSLHAQKFDYEYIGVIKLHQSQEKIISYQLLFNEKNGQIEGVSITDLEGKHQTKNRIKGTFNPKNNELSYKETDIIYTKSEINQTLFCHIHFLGKMKKQEKKAKISGEFKGYFPDGSPCTNGSIEMIAMQKVEKIAAKITQKIAQSKNLSDQEKEKIAPSKALDSLKINVLKENENIHIFVKNEQIQISLWDNGQVDDDRIDLLLNDSLLLKDFSLHAEKKIWNIAQKKQLNTFKIKAKNEGKYPPNSVRIDIKDGSQIFSLITGLKEGQQASISIYKK